ncbi:hypothetical protein FRC14_007310 [Serendipita sp. 396]|nr:hypothetical protein FRC14_007310 [Serendipita sp. 396]
MSSVLDAGRSSGDRDGEELLNQWRASTLEQEALLKRLLEENIKLKKQVTELEMDNYTTRLAVGTLRQELETARREVDTCKGEMGNLQRNRTWIPVLIDGDGYIFNKELLSKGEIGGREAASMLNSGVLQYIKSQGYQLSHPVIYTMIFLSKELLENILVKSDTCSQDEFKWFIKGFSQAHPLFSFITVGASKEAADSKIREHLNKFIRLNEVHQVIVGGTKYFQPQLLGTHHKPVDHDNGYSAALSAELTAGHKEKLVLLRAHKVVAREIASLGLENFWIDGLFMTEKISSNPFSPRMQIPNLDSPLNPPEPLPRLLSTPPTQNSSPRLMKDTNLPKRVPAPCNFLYLTGKCNNGNSGASSEFYRALSS